MRKRDNNCAAFFRSLVLFQIVRIAAAALVGAAVVFFNR